MAVMLLADCGICGRTELGVTKSLPEPGALLRVTRHKQPGGSWCVVTQVDPATLREGRRGRRPRRAAPGG
jgi:hypothetical protein